MTCTAPTYHSLTETLSSSEPPSSPSLQAIKRKGDKPWASLSMKEKAGVVSALDWLSFDFVEAIKVRLVSVDALASFARWPTPTWAEGVGPVLTSPVSPPPPAQAEGPERADAWLWQLNEALPLLAAEPARKDEPEKALKALQDLFAPLEAELSSVLDARRRAQLEDAKGLVKQLTVAGSTRNLQVRGLPRSCP